MGSWNGTCMLSNLPIEVGDKIKLILLKDKFGLHELKRSGGYVYSDEIFKPVYLPISGVYDDYGCIEKIVEDSNYKLIEESLKKQLGDVITVGSKRFEDNNYVLKDIIKGIERGSLKYIGVDKDEIKEKKFAKFMYDHIIERDSCLDPTNEYLLSKINMDVSNRERLLNMTFVMIREDVWNHVIKYNNECDSIEEIENLSEYILNDGAKILKKQMYKNFLDIASKEVGDEILKTWYEFSSINLFVSLSRIGYMPQAGKGSQYSSFNLNKMLAEKIIEICDENIEDE